MNNRTLMLLVLGFCVLASFQRATAQCGVTWSCIQSFNISPGEIIGDNEHVATATATAILAPNANNTWLLELQNAATLGVSWNCVGTENAPASGGAGFNGGCYVTGTNVTVQLTAIGSGQQVTDQLVGRVGYTQQDPGITTPLIVDPPPNPYENPNNDPDLPSPCDTKVPAGSSGCGSPINVTNGNTWIQKQDYFMPGIGVGLTLTRTWNSLWANAVPPEESGVFGDSWRSTFEERIQVLTGGSVKYWKGNGSSLFFTYSGSGGVYYLSAPGNDQTTLSFNSTSNLWTATQQDGTQRIFNNAGYLTSIVDLNGNTTSVNVDSAHQNRISTVTDPSGNVLTFNYTNASFPRLCTSISDAVGTFTQYQYDSSGRLLQVLNPDGSQQNFAYNDPNSSTLISLVTDSMGRTLEAHTYDSQRRGLTSQEANDSNGHAVNKVTIYYGYPASNQNYVCDSSGGNCTAITVSNAVQRHFLVATSGGGACSTCGFQGNSSATLFSNGNKASYKDAAGNLATYTYDSNGNLQTKVLPEGNPFTNTTGFDTWNYSYNQWGELHTVTDPLGSAGDPNHTTTYAYDTRGNLTSVTTPPPNSTTPSSVTSYQVNAQGQVTQITDPLLNKTTIQYCVKNQTACPYGLIYYVQDALGHKTTYSYDGRGNQLSETDALTEATNFQYDAMNRVKLITYPTSPATTVQIHYDWRGRRDYIIDQNSNKTSYGYDDADRIVKVTDAQTPSPGVTTYGYDTESNLTDITDAKLNHTHINYAGPNPLNATFPSGYTESYGYNGNNLLTTMTDRNGGRLYFYYDYQNRLMRRFYPDIGGNIDYSYDPAGRMTEVQDARSGSAGTYTFNYDNMARLSSAVTNYAFANLPAYTISYGYDAASNRTSMTDPQTIATAYTYDTMNRLKGLAFNGQNPGFGFGYDTLNRRNSLTRPNGINTAYAYDPVSRLTSVLHKLGSTVLDGAAYTYDGSGNRQTRTDKRTGTTLTYGYDHIYQLLSAKQGSTAKESYTYDIVGNRLTSLGVSPYSYNSSNELTGTPSGSYSYDNNGNTETKPDGTQYSWDINNELTQVVLPGTGGTVSFLYDPFGRRIQKSLTKSGSTTTTLYLYDQSNRIEDLMGTSGTLLARYVSTRSVDEPLEELVSGQTSYYEQDGLNTVSSLSNPSGALINTYSYDSYGKLLAMSGTAPNPFQFTGREFDSETGVYDYRARYYDENIGRFSSEDAVKLNGVLKNIYTYVLNNPVRYIDAYGLSAQDVQNIKNQAQGEINSMTANGQRIDPGWLNNLTASLESVNPFRKKPPLLGCGQQADRLASDLQFNLYDDHWTFDVEQDGPFHQRARATSSNPSDPDIIIDPFNNLIFTVPKGGR